VLAAKHLLCLGRLDLLLQLVEGTLEIRPYVLSRVGPLDEDSQIVATAPQRLGERTIFLEPTPTLHDLLGFGLIAPEVRACNALPYLDELIVQAGGLKGASAVPPPCGSGLRTA
jgi:hypothetical protein